MVFSCQYMHRAAAMTRRLSGLTAWIKKVAPKSESRHCVIHKEMLNLCIVSFIGKMSP